MAYIKCPHCGRTLTDDATVCPLCGSLISLDSADAAPNDSAPSVPSANQVCPQCGAPVPADDRFCTRCGALVGMSEPPRSQQAAAQQVPQQQAAAAQQAATAQQAPQQQNPYQASYGACQTPPPESASSSFGACQSPPPINGNASFDGYSPQQPGGVAPGTVPPQYGAPGAPANPGAKPKGSGKAVASLICGIVSIILGSILLGIVAIVLASQYVKSFGADAKATAGKVCGIIGSAISCILIVALTAFSVMDISDNDILVEGSSQESAIESAGVSDDAAYDAACEAIDRLHDPDGAMMKAMAAEADLQFQNAFDYSLTDIGLDPADLVAWSVGTLECDLSAEDVYVAGDEGNAFADTECVTIYAIIESVEIQVEEFNDAGGTVPDEAALKAKYAEFVEIAKDAAEPESYFLCFDLEKKGDSWAVDEDSFYEEAEYVFSMYDIF